MVSVELALRFSGTIDELADFYYRYYFSIAASIIFVEVFTKHPVKFFSPLRYFWFICYIPVLFFYMLIANFDVVYRVIHPKMPIKPGIVKVKTRLKSESGRTALANSITLTPGTVTMDVTEAVKGAKGGSVEFRVEKAGIIHAGVGKASFTEQALVENIKAFVDSVMKAKPAGAKGTYLKKVSLTSTQGPGVRIDTGTVTSAA